MHLLLSIIIANLAGSKPLVYIYQYLQQCPHSLGLQLDVSLLTGCIIHIISTYFPVTHVQCIGQTTCLQERDLIFFALDI